MVPAVRLLLPGVALPLIPANRLVSILPDAVSPAAVTLRGYAEAMFRWFGHQPALTFQAFDDWKQAVAPEDAQATWDHIIRSPSHSIAKAERLLGYRPRWTSLQAVQDSVAHLLS